MFIQFDPADAFSGGKPAAPFVRVVGVIRGGRDGPTRAKLLAALHSVIGAALKGNAVAEITLLENRPEVRRALFQVDLASDLVRISCSG